MERKNSLRKHANFSWSILISSWRILRSLIPSEHPGSFHFQSNLQKNTQHEKLNFGELLNGTLGNNYYGALTSLLATVSLLVLIPRVFNVTCLPFSDYCNFVL